MAESIENKINTNNTGASNPRTINESSPIWPAEALCRQQTMPVSPASTIPASPAETLDQSIAFLQMLSTQLSRPDANRDVLQRELNHVVRLLDIVRTTTKSSAFEVERSLQQDLKRRVRSSATTEDADVIEWISSQYNAPSRTLDQDENDDSGRSPPPPVVVESVASQNFRSTMLCMRWVRKVRESVHRRALLNSPWESILNLHISDPIRAILSRVDEWDFDLFALERLAGRRVLSVLAYHIFEERLNCFTQFDIKPAFFANFIATIEDGYKDVPYHSHIHAADVLQNTYYFLTRPSQRKILSNRPLDLFSACIAAAIHDYKHPGTNNAFQVATGSRDAWRYNDRAVLENMHVSEAFLVTRRPHHNIFSGLKSDERFESRSTIIAMVLATDMSSHFKNLGELKSHLDVKHTKQEEWNAANAHERLICLETALHCADLGNPTKPLPIYLEWTDRVMSEFFDQGDRERELGMPISPMCDRLKPNIPRSQIGFMDFIVQPIYDAYVQLNREIESTCLNHIKSNRAYFAQLVTNQTTTTATTTTTSNTNPNNPSTSTPLTAATTTTEQKPEAANDKRE